VFRGGGSSPQLRNDRLLVECSRSLEYSPGWPKINVFELLMM
jgi:hypothetical protein